MLLFTIFLLFWQKASFSVYGNKLKIVLCGVSFFIAPYVTIGAGRRCDVNLNFHLRNHMGDKPLICVIFIYNFTHSYIHSCCNFVMIILDSIIALCVIKRYNLVSNLSGLNVVIGALSNGKKNNFYKYLLTLSRH